MVQQNNSEHGNFGRKGKMLSLRRSTQGVSVGGHSAGSTDRSNHSQTFAPGSRGSTRKRTVVAREAPPAILSDTSSDDGDGAKPVVSGWLVRLHQMLTLGRDEVIEYDDGQLVIRDPDLLASELLPTCFRTSRFSSFQRQLNNFGFRKIQGKGKLQPCIYVRDDLVGQPVVAVLGIDRVANGPTKPTASPPAPAPAKLASGRTTSKRRRRGESTDESDASPSPSDVDEPTRYTWAQAHNDRRRNLVEPEEGEYAPDAPAHPHTDASMRKRPSHAQGAQPSYDARRAEEADWYGGDVEDDLGLDFPFDVQQRGQQRQQQQQLQIQLALPHQQQQALPSVLKKQQQHEQQQTFVPQRESTGYCDQQLPHQENSRGASPITAPAQNLYPGVDMENMTADDIIEVVTLLDSGLFLGSGALGNGAPVYDSAMACY